MKFTGKEFKSFQEALLDAFPSLYDLKKMVRIQFEKNLSTIASGNDLEQVTFVLIEAAEKGGWLEQLIQKAHEFNPGNEKLKDFIKTLSTIPASKNPEIDEEVSKIRRKMLQAKSERELREALFEIEALLGKYPYHAEGRLLKEDILKALKRMSVLDEKVSDLRGLMLQAKSERELREALFEIEALLKENPYHTAGRLLKKDILVALRPKKKPFFQPILAVLAIILIVVGYAYYKFTELTKDMAFIPPGDYEIGYKTTDPLLQVCVENKAYLKDMKFYMPSQSIITNGFYIDPTEVSCQQYEEFLLANPNIAKDHLPYGWQTDNGWKRNCGANYPIIGVSIADAQAYAKWKGKRLPTWEEWLWAAFWSTGGYDPQHTFVYPWNHKQPQQITDADVQLNYKESPWKVPLPISDPSIGKFQGLCGMFGNVDEFAILGKNFVAIGGSYRSPWRIGGTPWLAEGFIEGGISESTGFRLMKDSPVAEKEKKLVEDMIPIPPCASKIDWISEDPLFQLFRKEQFVSDNIIDTLRNIQPHKIIHLEQGFYIDKYEVSRKQFNKFVKDLKRYPSVGGKEFDSKSLMDILDVLNLSDTSELPVSTITNLEARAYAYWLRKRLPTIEEFEIAAHGKKPTIFPWGNVYNKDVCNGSDNLIFSNYCAVNELETGKSPFGVYNLVGNVREYSISMTSNGEFYVFGGYWEEFLPLAGMSFYRGVSFEKDIRVKGTGMRCALTDKGWWDLGLLGQGRTQ